MAAAYKTLGQANPSATTQTVLYTAGVQAVASTLFICNQGTADATFRVAVRPGGATLAAQHWIYYDEPLPYPGHFTATVGLSIAAADVVTVWASTGSVSFTLSGAETP